MGAQRRPHSPRMLSWHRHSTHPLRVLTGTGVKSIPAAEMPSLKKKKKYPPKKKQQRKAASHLPNQQFSAGFPETLQLLKPREERKIKPLLFPKHRKHSRNEVQNSSLTSKAFLLAGDPQILAPRAGKPGLGMLHRQMTASCRPGCGLPCWGAPRCQSDAENVVPTRLEAGRRRKVEGEGWEDKVYAAAKGSCAVGDGVPLLPGWVISICGDAKTRQRRPHGQGQQDAAAEPPARTVRPSAQPRLCWDSSEQTAPLPKRWPKGVFRGYFLCC